MILPSDLHALRLLRLAPLPIGTKHLSAKQRRRFTDAGWISEGLHQFGSYQTPHFIMTEYGRQALDSFLSTKTLEDTFK